MSKWSVTILFAATLAFSGCTVHHYHHKAGAKQAKKGHRGMKGHSKRMSPHGSKGHGALPAGHPPIGGDMCKGHGGKCKGHGGMPEGHGMKGHGGMPKGHGMKGHGGMPKGHGMKGHGGMPKGHPSVGQHAPSSHGAPFDPLSEHHGKGGEHSGHKEGHGDHGKGNLPPEVVAFHDSFAAAWHKEKEDERRSAACAKVAEWKKLAQGVKKLSGGVVLAAATKDLHKKTMAVVSSCARKKGDVQAALVSTHDALHMLFKVAAQPKKAAQPNAEAGP